jgi:iron complex outermembrane recepter protein
MSFARSRQSPVKQLAISLALVAGLAAPARADDAQKDLTDIGFEELMQIQITSVAKKPQRLVDTAAAVFVLTQDDIRRSGHMSVPELLRMVPGVNVAHSTASGWQVGIRGDQEKFSRSLLPLIDGRSIYTPAFSGTYWDAYEIPLEDIERIEVIRGPGASVWGSNAVQGVINIIRKSTAESQESSGSIAVGDEERLLASLSHTFALSDWARLRMGGRYINRDGHPARVRNFDRPDDYSQGTLHFRLDLDSSERDELTLQGDWQGGMRGGGFRVDSDTTGNNFTQAAVHYDVRGGNAMFKWRRTFSESASMDAQLYWDTTRRDLPIANEQRSSYDSELRFRFSPLARHDVSAGAGARHQRDRWESTVNLMVLPEKNEEAIYNGFLQDEIAILPDALTFTLGSKFEWNTYTGWEVQPTARFLYHLTNHQQIWGAVARASRIPSRSDREIAATPLILLGIPSRFSGSPDADSEFVVEYDLGYRAQPMSTLQIDLAAFYRETENFKTFVGIPGSISTAGIAVPAVTSNAGELQALGVEVSVRWQPFDRWRLLMNWSHENLSGNELPVNSQGGVLSAPHHQFDVISQWTLPYDLALDLAFYYNGNMIGIGGTEYSSYRRHDARIAWTPRPDFELAVVGQNLLDHEHHEALDFFEIDAWAGFGDGSVPRSVYIQLRKTF